MKNSLDTQKLLRSYLLVTFFYGLLGLLDAAFFSRNGVISDINTYHYLATFIFFSFFFFSIVALISFIQYSLPRIALVLPVYTIVSKITIIIAAFAWASTLANANIDISTQPVPVWLIYGAVFLSLFECVFSLFLLRRFNML
ncbi:hypothetical protein HY639_05820 [Candidatus Woesearchaeota archaeon]|nr:hypothetical protein [Candidatus Woesearchaeota archaeon]